MNMDKINTKEEFLCENVINFYDIEFVHGKQETKRDLHCKK